MTQFSAFRRISTAKKNWVMKLCSQKPKRDDWRLITWFDLENYAKIGARGFEMGIISYILANSI